MRIALFITCFNDTLAPEVGQATVRVLRHLGHEVTFPAAQACCGQLHFNTGDRSAAIPMVRRFVDAFAGADVIVTPSPSCAAMIRDHHATLADLAAERGDDPGLPAAVAATLPRVFELSELLVDRLGVTEVGAVFPYRVAFHPTCHSVRLLHIGDRPQRLLAGVAGARIGRVRRDGSVLRVRRDVRREEPGHLLAMGADKLAAVEAVAPDALTAADTSCLLHLGGMLSRRASPIRPLAPGPDPGLAERR